jgi:putative membrane protein
MRIALAALHLLALGLGVGAVLARAGALREAPAAAALRRALRADVLWGVAAGLWLITGLWRWLGGVDKPAAFYLHNGLFHAKLGLFLLVVGLEVWPMVHLIRCRRGLAAGRSAEEVMTTGSARRIAAISSAQALVVVAMIFVAAAIARGYGVRG